MKNGEKPVAVIEKRDAGIVSVVAGEKDASRVHNKGAFGTPGSGGRLVLDPFETVFLTEVGRITLLEKDKKEGGTGGGPMGFESAFRFFSSAVEGFEIRYLVYRDLRTRGFITKWWGEEADFRVYERGSWPGRDLPGFWVTCFSERWPVKVEDLLPTVKRGFSLGKNVMAAIVDEEGDITYYALSMRHPEGFLPSPVPPGWKGTGVFFGDRIIVFEDAGEKLFSWGFYGKKMRDAIQISLVEGAFLMDRGLRVVDSASGEVLEKKDLEKVGDEIEPLFALRLRVYTDLRQRGLIPKTGFKYGSHFRAYDIHPDQGHARFLVHSIPQGQTLSWHEISRGVRLAHGVKKEFLLATPSPDNDKEGKEVNREEIIYLRMRWVSP